MFNFTRRQVIALVIVTILFGIGNILGYLLLQQLSLLVSQTMLLVLIIAMLIMLHNAQKQRLDKKLDNTYQQIEALFSLFSTVKFRYPLPAMGGWAITPDFAKTVTALIKEHKPKLILELGSGVSTLVSAYSLQEVRQGQVVSFEHEKQFAAISSAALLKHAVQDSATVIYAPLKETVIAGKTWLWYDTDQLKTLEHIDMVIVDGPPATTQKLARYPALPVLYPLLSADAVILVDDALREDEQQMVRRWLQEFADFSLEELELEKGGAILRRQPVKAH